MKRRLAFIFALLLAAPASAQLSAPPSLLLAVDFLPDSPFLCARQRTELLLYRDRLVIEKDQQPTSLRIFVYQAPPEAMLDLAQALAENRIDLLAGDCSTQEFVPNGGFLNRIDWFGRWDRHSAFRLGDVVKPFPPCSAEVLAMQGAIEIYVGRARQNPTLAQLELPHPAGPPCPP